MKIELNEISVRDLTEGYSDNDEDGVRGYRGRLDIRPPFQREFIYKDNQRDAVINTITNNFPLNVMYWAVRDDGTYEIIDGQQRTISVAQYVIGDFSINGLKFHNLQNDKQQQILNYKLMIYFCSGTDSERLDWFETINIAGQALTKQELRNAVYAGPWATDAKSYFSKNGCVAQKIGSDYLSGKAIRQEYLETAIKWISKNNIEAYMSDHQHDPTAISLWNYFRSVIDWVSATFTNKRSEIMKSVDWGSLYDEFKDAKLRPTEIEEETAKLILDDDVTKKSGIYPYILTRNEKYLNIRVFSDAMKRKAYERQKGICVLCDNDFELNKMEGDHITPWVEGGKTNEDNCQMLCKDCNRRKSAK